MQVESVTVYPVKSARGVPRSSSPVELAGLRGDRRWMVVDPAGKPITARAHPLMFTISAVPDDTDGSLRLGAPGRPELRVPAPEGDPDVDVQISRLAAATSGGAAAAAWVSAVLGEPATLVWLDDPARRPVGPSHGGLPGDPLSLADAGPVLLATTASLRRLQEWIAADPDPRATNQLMSLARFRPNVVVGGDVGRLGEPAPFAEDAWRRVAIGDVEYRFGECCDRCVMTTIDPQTLAGGNEPIRTLAKHRRWDGKVWFGVRLTPLHPGTVAVGDPVVVLD